MKNKKLSAVALRKKGHSYNEIRKQFDIPKSTLSYWLKNVKISETARNKIMLKAKSASINALIKRNKNQTKIAKIKEKRIINESANELSKLIDNKLFLIGLSLYWAEGYKNREGSWKNVDFANSDPAMVEIMIKFFVNICGVRLQDIKIQIMVHENTDVKQAISYWHNKTKISKKNCSATIIKSKASQGKRINILPHGTVHLRIYDRVIFYKLLGWIEGLKQSDTRSAI